MSATVIDTLRFADRLKEAGFERPQAEGMARALGDELAERMLTRRDLHEALGPIHARLDAMDARFEGIDARLDAMDAKFERRFEGVDARLDAMDAKFEGKFEGIDTRFDAMDSNTASMYRELSGKFNVLLGVMALGFTLLASLGGYNAIAPRFGQTIMGAPETLQEATNLPLSRLGAPSDVPQA